MPSVSIFEVGTLVRIMCRIKTIVKDLSKIYALMTVPDLY